MNVVFLDIDGVLQPYNSCYRFDNLSNNQILELSKKWNVDYSKYGIDEVSAAYYDWEEQAICRLKHILKETNSKIIVSSDWRSKEQPYKMRDLLAIHYLADYWYGDNAILGVGFGGAEVRAKEIEDSLNKYPIDNFVVLDDMPELGCYFPDNSVITSNYISLNNMNKCVRILKNR